VALRGLKFHNPVKCAGVASPLTLAVPEMWEDHASNSVGPRYVYEEALGRNAMDVVAVRFRAQADSDVRRVEARSRR
jgi:hypothetical protein